jgi:hypothetical protein
MEGVVGGDVDMSMAKEAARRCAIAIPAEAQSHLGSLDRIKRCVWVGGMVNACTGFRDHPAVINEVSQLRVRRSWPTCSGRSADSLSMRRSRCKRFSNFNDVGAYHG